jgi:hypothetical protein
MVRSKVFFIARELAIATLRTWQCPFSELGREFFLNPETVSEIFAMYRKALLVFC